MSFSSNAMKSVLRSIALRIEEQSDDVNDSRPSVSVATMESTSEQQLAELKLLSRVEHDVSSSESFTSGEHGDDEVQRHERRDTGQVEKKSMFTALLGSANILTNQPIASASSSSGAVSTSAPKITTPERFRRGSTLPTLCEESFEEECDVREDEIAILERSASCDSPDVSSCRSPDSLYNMSAFHDQMSEAEPENGDPEQDDDEEDDDEAFAHMLSQLPRDFELLVLSSSDLTTQRLERVRTALTSQHPESSKFVADASSDPEQRVEASESINYLAVFKMRRTRTVVAVDTLRMLVQRHGGEKVMRAITSAVRQVFKEHALETGIDPLAQAPIVITSSNITRVTLEARHALMGDDQLSKTNNKHQRRCSASSSAPSQKSQRQTELRSPSPVRTAASGRSQPNQLRSPRGVAGSPAFREASIIPSTSPLTPQPRSILANDGAHVLMQEKISAFQYRGTSGSGLSSFKVRRDGVAKVEAAAVRRQRSIMYGNEQTRKPLGK